VTPTGLTVTPRIDATFKIVRAPGLHADHDPAAECERTDPDTGPLPEGTCRLVERVSAHG